MTTKMHRLTVSLPDHVLKAVQAMAEQEERPYSKVIVSILSEFAPTMLELAKFQKQMKAGQKAQATKTMQHLYGDQFANMMREQMDLVKSKK